MSMYIHFSKPYRVTVITVFKFFLQEGSPRRVHCTHWTKSAIHHLILAAIC